VIRLRILVTNDDGFDSPGLHALARAAAADGHEVVVAAPDSEMSGASASITAHDAEAVTAAGGRGRVRVEQVASPVLDGDDAFRVHAAPALIALLAAHEAFGRAPDLVLSGINRGANVGRAILHSGTVGSALTGGVNGARGLAVSLAVDGEDAAPHWSTAAAIARLVIPRVMAAPPGTVANLNVPDTHDVGSVRLVETPLAHFGIVHTTVTDRNEEHFVVLEIIDPDDAPDPRSDVAFLERGHATITCISSIAESGYLLLGESAD